MKKIELDVGQEQIRDT